MTLPLCQVRTLTPESDRFECLRARLDQAEPDLLRAACRHRRALPLPDVRARLAVRFQTIHNIFCKFEEEGCDHPPDLPRHSPLHLYRIAQEATSNAHRHGRANAVAIRLACHEGAVTLTVRDDGRGFGSVESEEEDRPDGLGRHMMRYRANLLGGTLSVRPGPQGTGTLVRCVFDPALDQDRSDRNA